MNNVKSTIKIRLVAIFGFIMAIHYDAPWYIFLLGAICVILDGEKE